MTLDESWAFVVTALAPHGKALHLPTYQAARNEYHNTHEEALRLAAGSWFSGFLAKYREIAAH